MLGAGAGGGRFILPCHIYNRPLLARRPKIRLALKNMVLLSPLVAAATAFRCHGSGRLLMIALPMAARCGDIIYDMLSHCHAIAGYRRHVTLECHAASATLHC